MNIVTKNSQFNSKKHNLICGMEIHVELKTNSKMFCGCKNDPFYAKKPNIHTCPVCLGMPGGLPTINRKAVEWTIKLGLALNCKINLISKFDRKHYFYPDLPKGYQISQLDLPFCYDGFIETNEGRVDIDRIHLEEDTAKLIHTSISGHPVSLIDFNRSSVPLIEIVSKPSIFSANQAVGYAKKLREIIKYLEISDCDMEQGGMRLEANLSLQTPEQSKNNKLPNYKVEVKNINSFRFLHQAIEFESTRQLKLLKSNQTPKQETRGWNSQKNQTIPQRDKDNAIDYRYFTDPDLPPIHFSQKQISQWQSELPKLPDDINKQWYQNYRIELRFAEKLSTSSSQTDWLSKVFALLQANKLDPNKGASLFVNKKIAIDTKAEPKKMVQEFKKITEVTILDTEVIEKLIIGLIKNHPDEIARYKAGETKLLGFFLGLLRPHLPKSSDMKAVATALQKALD